jgi:hypothetical protein
LSASLGKPVKSACQEAREGDRHENDAHSLQGL